MALKLFSSLALDKVNELLVGDKKALAEYAFMSHGMFTTHPLFLKICFRLQNLLLPSLSFHISIPKAYELF